jgi:hypothetical protein
VTGFGTRDHTFPNRRQSLSHQSNAYLDKKVTRIFHSLWVPCAGYMGHPLKNSLFDNNYALQAPILGTDVPK